MSKKKIETNESETPMDAPAETGSALERITTTLTVNGRDFVYIEPTRREGRRTARLLLELKEKHKAVLSVISRMNERTGLPEANLPGVFDLCDAVSDLLPAVAKIPQADADDATATELVSALGVLMSFLAKRLI